MSERIGPAPYRAERANSRLIQNIQELETLVDGFRPFYMKNSRQDAVIQASVNVIDVAAYANPTLGVPLDTEQKGQHAEHNLLRRRQLDDRRRWDVDDVAWQRCFTIGGLSPVGRGHEN